MTDAPHRHALGDPRIAWTVRLTATLEQPLEASLAESRMHRLAERNGWTAPYPLTVTTDAHRITLAADHRHLDGQAMLAALSFLLETPVRSRATGVDASRTRSGLGLAGVQRLAELIARPSATIPATADRSTGTEDALTDHRLPRRASTSDLVVAAARAVATRASGPISVAIGVAGPVGSGEVLADHSGYLRIRDARGLSRPDVSTRLRTAPLQPGNTAPSGAAGALARLATKLLADRLGSTLLISHLGDIEGEGITDLAFYPVSGGASGLSLGAATVRDRTTITLRARGSEHDRDGLHHLLETIAAELA